MNSLNLHGIVRSAINAVHPSIPATLYQSTGQINDASGMVRPTYAPGETVSIQVQSEGPSVLEHTDRVGMEEVSRKFYLFSAPDMDKRVAGIVRELSRNGDMIHMEDGTWWLITAIVEDFTRSGWASVRGTLQVSPPDFSFSECYRQ